MKTPTMNCTTLAALVAFAALATVAAPLRAEAKIKVVASITDLASIASTVGGDDVEVSVIAKPTSDVHRVEALPSYMVRVSKAQMYLKVGLGLDQWADAIIDGSRNPKIAVVDCSRDVPVLEKPASVDANLARQGDVHPFGNPHYWLDPRNGGVVAAHLAEEFGKIDPAHAADFQKRAQDFAADAEKAAAECADAGKSIPGHQIITYHSSWIYLARACGLDIVAHVEPVPGIPPTAGHLKELADLIRTSHIPVVLYEPYFSNDAGDFLARETGVRIAKLSPSCDDAESGSYLAHFHSIAEALKGGPGTSRS